MNQRHSREETLFFAAAEMATPEMRAAFLDRECAGDAALRQRVEALLKSAGDSNQPFMSGPPLPEGMAPIAEGPKGTVIVPVTEKAGDRIGRYKLLQQIGEGGCGVVYMAEQSEPVRRRVALKVIKLGMDTKQVVARFEAERQALAIMDHPNIAKVFDAGATDTGRPYFVMELVRGTKITEFCDQQQLSMRERLELFIHICAAIHHAHQKGIIHRDLKPSNVLVMLHDGVPVPKVIDFGIAKATNSQQLTDKTLFTAFEQFIGTPAYMSPEQAEMSALEIDTRSDIYSLGVVLYELLTGRPPFDARRLLESGLEEIRRIIREEEPPRPSTRLSTLDAAEQADVAKRRQSEPPKLLGVIRGDLDWIVMKCLEKDRSRRYDTADSFGQDLRRYLEDEPVMARAPSAGYKFAKFARRNRVALSVAATIASLTVALSGSVFLLVKEFQAGKYSGLTIHSNPEGAEVWRAGQKVGTTPFELSAIPIGQLTYSLVLSNYESVTNTTFLAPKKWVNDFTFLRQIESPGIGRLSEPSRSRLPGMSGIESPGTEALSKLTPGYIERTVGIESPGSGTLSNPGSNLTLMTITASRGATLLSAEGKVEVAQKGTDRWTSVRTNTVLYPGDRLRTGPLSRATLRWQDDSLFRVAEWTWIEIGPTTHSQGKTSPRLPEGTIYRFNRDGTSNSFQIKAPVATGKIRG